MKVSILLLAVPLNDEKDDAARAEEPEDRCSQ
jgi:hypothetical protein